MSLNAKTLIFFSTLMGLLFLILGAISLYSFRQFSLYTAERHARSVAETVKVGLTESMVNGTISKRPQFLDRLSTVPGVQGVRVVRGDAVARQFGTGLTQEHAASTQEKQVLSHGEASFTVIDKGSASLFRAVIPYTASASGVPNCLQCHAVSDGAVLGAVSIDIPLSEVRNQAIVATLLISFSVLFTALVGLLILRRQLRPLVKTAGDVKHIVSEAVNGHFNGRVVQNTSDEVGEIAGNMNRLLSFLDDGLTTISRQVGELMGYQPKNAGNQLVTTTEMVDALVEAAKFKQAIEEDQTKLEVYQRLAWMLNERYDFHQFSIYEIANSKNRITPIIVDNEINANMRWCDPQIMIDANACRVRRTGHEINAVECPGLCTMFRDADPSEAHTHICLPITQSGAVGCVVQIVVPKDHAQLAKFLIPFVSVYLRETAPVLEAKRLMEHLKESALRDAMTGLYNRRFLEEYITTLVATSQRRDSPFAILMLDLDYFKQVNDTFGHEAGDKVIKTLADILLNTVRSSDMVVRYGGEEFLVVLQDSKADQALRVAEKIRAKVEETKIPLPGTILQKTISIGVSEFPTDADSFWQVVKFADVALYQAKHLGRNQVVRFTPEMWSEEEKY